MWDRLREAPVPKNELDPFNHFDTMPACDKHTYKVTRTGSTATFECKNLHTTMGGTPIGTGGSYPPLFYTVGARRGHKLTTANQ